MSKILFLDPNQWTKGFSKISTHQLLGLMSAYENLGHDCYIGYYTIDNDRRYPNHKEIDMYNTFDLNNFDFIFLINFHQNCYGGCEVKSIAKTFQLLHTYNGKIIYLLSDFQMTYEPYHLDKAEKFGYDKDSLLIDEHKITFLCQSFNEQLTKELLKKDFIQFPVQYMTLYKNRNKTKNNLLFNFKTYDLIYGGSFRAGRREEKMKYYLFDNNLDTAVYGTLKLDKFKNFNYKTAPTFLGKLNKDDLSNVNQSSYATIVIGDKSYNDNFFTLRIYEALRDDIILFIDNEFDSNRLLGFSEFHYVKDKQELKEKIDLLKTNKDLYENILNEQQSYYSKYTDEYFEQCCSNILTLI